MMISKVGLNSNTLHSTNEVMRTSMTNEMSNFPNYPSSFIPISIPTPFCNSTTKSSPFCNSAAKPSEKCFDYPSSWSNGSDYAHNSTCGLKTEGDSLSFSRFFPTKYGSFQPSSPLASSFLPPPTLPPPSLSAPNLNNSRKILKITNIPWDIGSNDIFLLFQEYSTMLNDIHIPIDRLNGKTKNEAYVEFSSSRFLLDALATKHRKAIKGREIFLNRSSSDELLKIHFPKSRTDLKEYITAEEISSIGVICKYYKIHFSRKCAERPFEHVISIIKLLPWGEMSTVGKDQCFELLKLAIEALLIHLNRAHLTTLNKTLLQRLVNVGLEYAILTENQKEYLLEMKENYLDHSEIETKDKNLKALEKEIPLNSIHASDNSPSLKLESLLLESKEKVSVSELTDLINTLITRIHELEFELDEERKKNCNL